MKPLALNLDHCGTIVRDLDLAQQAFQDLGFKLTLRSHHVGSPSPGAPIEPLGSANHCAMLQQGYLEVLGHVDPAKTSNAVAMLKRYEGVHIVAFRPESSEAIQTALIDQGQPVDPVRNLERMTPFGLHGKEMRRVAFRNMRFNTEVFTEAQFQYTEHLTRSVMWQTHLLEHPNGALALDCVYMCSPDPEATAKKLSPLLGVEPQSPSTGEFVLAFARSSLRILSPAVWQAQAPGAPLPPLPAPVGFAVLTNSLLQAQEVFQGNVIPFQRTPAGGLRVRTCGTVIEFFEKGAR